MLSSVLSKLVIVLGLLQNTKATPEPWPAHLPRCATECPVMGSSILSYLPETTYTYAYTGRSQVHVEDVPDGVTHVDWSAQVDLTWIGPCDVAISFKHIVVEDVKNLSFLWHLRQLEMNPMLMAVSDGRVQHVCPFTADEPWSINLKKGVASAFQNSLPTTSPISSGLNFTEVDVIGKCPTRYETENEGNTIKVKKTKNHKLCENNFYTNSRKILAWQKAPLPLEESKSECRQEITNGIYTSIICEDTNIVRASFGSYKYVVAHQKSTFSYLSESSDIPSIARYSADNYKTSLLYEHEAPDKRADESEQLDETLKEVCEKTSQNIEEDAALLMAKVIRLLRTVRESVIESALQRIASGQICPNHQRIEALFLDAIAFVREPEVVNIMVKELISGRAIGGRDTLYTSALYLTPRPNIESIEALQPLFEVSRPLGFAKLAAASMVNAFCRHNPHCENLEPIKKLASTLAQHIEQNCVPSEHDSTEQKALASLKALGNMGVIPSEVAKTVIKCMETDYVHSTIRVAAAQAFRNAKCERHPTKQLVNILTDETKNTEVRIASYLAAIRCAEKEDLDHIISKISPEKNTQVRGFVLSHLLNLQETSLPYKEKLKFLLINDVLPINFTTDFRKYSRNIEKSYFIESLGLGAGMESDVIYNPGSFVPRTVNLNLTSAVGGVAMNLGEFGTRIEGLETIIEKVFGPKGDLKNHSLGSILHNIVGSVKEKGARFLENAIPNLIRPRRSINFATISNFLNKIYSRKQPGIQRADVFARFDGQEIAYGHLAGDLSDIDIDIITESIYNFVDEIIDQLYDISINSARTAQINFDYHIPTIQGIPLKLQMEGTAVIGFKMDSKLKSKILSNSLNFVEIMPGLALQVDGFVGFDMYFGRAGLKMENLISSNNGIKVSLNVTNEREFKFEMSLPDKIDLFKVKSETYLMKEVEGHHQTKIMPSSVRDIRIEKKECITTFNSILGIRICQYINMPNIFRSEGLPLGQPSIMMFSVEKTDPSLKSYMILASFKHNEGSRVFTIKADTLGSTDSRSAESIITYKSDHDSQLLKASVKSSTIEGDLLIKVTQEEEYEAIETFGKWHSNGDVSMGGIKMEIKTTHERHHRNSIMTELNVYCSRDNEFPPDSKVFELELTKSFYETHHEVAVSFNARTVNDMRHYTDLNFHIEGDFKFIQRFEIWLPQRLKRFEFKCKAGHIIATSYIRQRQTADYQTEIIVTRMNEDLIHIATFHTIHFSSLFNMELVSRGRGHIMGSSYELSNEIACTSEKKGVMVTLTRASTGETLVHFEAITRNSNSNHNTKFVIDLPEWMEIVKFEGKLTRKDEKKHMLDIALQHGANIIMQVHGPVTVFGNLASSTIQFDIKIRTVTSNPVSVAFNLEWGRKKQVFIIDIRNEREMLFSGDWLLQVDRAQMWTIRSKFDFPIVADSNIEVLIRDKAIHVNTNSVLFPKSSRSRRIKSQLDVDFEKLEAKTDLAWDADHDTSKKLHVQLQMLPNPTNPDHITFHGTTNYLGNTFGLNIDTSGFDEHPWCRDLNIKITTASRNTLHLETKLKILRETSYDKLETAFIYKDLHNRVYKLKHTVTLHDQQATAKLKVATVTVYTNPHNQKTTFTTYAEYHNAVSERFLKLETSLLLPTLHSPMTLLFQIDNKNNVYSTELLVLEGLIIDVLKWEVKHHPTMGIRNIFLKTDLGPIAMILDTIHRTVWPNEHVHHSIHALKRVVYHLNYVNPSPNTHGFEVKIPSRAMEGEIEYSSNQYSIKFNPDKNVSNNVYEIGARVINAGDPTNNLVSEWRGRISHPSLGRHMESSLQVRQEGDIIRGRIELDLFYDKESRIIGTLESTRISPNALWIEVSLAARAFHMNPRVSITTAYAPHVIGFDFKFRRTPSSEVSIIMAGKIDRSQGKEAALAFTLQKDTERMVELSGSVYPENSFTCRGLGMKAVLHTPALGKQNIQSKFCEPGFLQIDVNSQESLNIYIAKLGYKYPGDAELSLTVEDKDTLQRLPLLMAKASLHSPTTIDIDIAQAADQLHRARDSTRAEWHKVAAILPTWLTSTISHIEGYGDPLEGNFPPSQFLKLIQTIKGELKAIYQDLHHDIAENPIVIWTKPSIISIWRRIYHVQHNLRNLRGKIIQAFNENFKELADTLVEVVVKILQMIEDERGLGLLDWIADALKKIPELQYLTEILENLILHHPEDLEALKAVFFKIINTLERDFNNLEETIAEIPDIQRQVYWLLGNYNSLVGLQMDKLLSRILHDLLFISVKTEDQHLKIEVPSYRPLNSLSQAIQFLTPKPATVVKDLVWLYYSFEPAILQDAMWSFYTYLHKHPKELFPPYKRTAVIVEGKEIITFDGVVLRVPLSPCKILLTAYKSSTLMMEHPEPSDVQQLTLKVHDVVALIKPDYQVFVNGHKMSGSHVREGSIEIEVRQGEITVTTPFMRIHVFKRTRVISVEVNGWTFGHIAGLLGSYDNEIADDWLTTDGAKASSLQELVRSWQEDQQCETPDINPIDIDRVPAFTAFKCNALLNGHSICRSVIQPEPFIKMCYATENVCHAEQAYRTICANKGVRQAFFLPC